MADRPERRSSRARPGGPARPVEGAGSPPPSFAPGGAAARPPVEGAVPVGEGARPAARRPEAPRRVTSRPRTAAPAGEALPAPTLAAARTAPAPRPARRRRRRWPLVLAVLLVLLLAWPVGLLVWADGRLSTVDALSGRPDTPGTTYLLAGSDERDGSVWNDGTVGGRTDSILLLHKPVSGPAALISLPRDTYVEIPGHGPNKLNAAFALGGAPLLVETVEGLTGLTVDHYVQIGMAGIGRVVDAVDGVRLCYEHDVDDEKSKLRWKAGCHTVRGKKALAFARMRYSDPEGDIGRAKRQQQLVGAVAKKLAEPENLWQPSRQVALVRAGTDALVVSEGTGSLDVARLALAFREARGEGGVTGTPPIASLDHRPGGIGSTVLLDPELAPRFFADLAAGRLEPGEHGGVPR